MREETIDENVTITWRDERQGRSLVHSEAGLQTLLQHFGIEPEKDNAENAHVPSSEPEDTIENTQPESSAAPASPDANTPGLRGKYALMKRPDPAPSEPEPTGAVDGLESGPSGTSTAATVTYETEQYSIQILRNTEPQTVLITRKPEDAVQEAAWRFAEERMAKIVRQDDELGVLFLDENIFVPFSKLAYDPQHGFQLL